MAYCSDKDSCSWKDLYVFPTTILETVRARYPRPFSWVKDSTFIQTGLHSNGRLLWTRLWFVSFLIGPGISSLCVFLAWDVLDRFVHFSSHYFLRLQLNIMYFGWWTLFVHGQYSVISVSVLIEFMFMPLTIVNEISSLQNIPHILYCYLISWAQPDDGQYNGRNM